MVALRSHVNPVVKSGFTLVELSIVLVIIGLIIGGVLVGRDLIDAAAIRAQISQIEKYNAAVNTFRGKYGYLPGDMPNPPAGQYGLKSAGDGNGILQGANGNGEVDGVSPVGEPLMLWVDLSAAGLIDGGFNTASPLFAIAINQTTYPQTTLYLPPAKIGNGNYVYVWSGGIYSHSSNPTGIATGDGNNYFGLAANVTFTASANTDNYYTAPGLNIQQAYAIDKKVDDGLPQSGKVTALLLGHVCEVDWAAGGANIGAHGGWAPGGGDCGTLPTTSATAGSTTTCYDNGNINGNPQQYSVEMSNGTGVNCALSFRFQ